jgi:hypothetical protein
MRHAELSSDLAEAGSVVSHPVGDLLTFPTARAALCLPNELTKTSDLASCWPLGFWNAYEMG